MAREARAWMHTDAVQALGKIEIDFQALGVHAMSVSAHKIYGPKGIGALIVDKRLELKPIVHGGGHEQGMRSGTENVPAIVGFGAACELAPERRQTLAQRTRRLRDQAEQVRRPSAQRFSAQARSACPTRPISRFQTSTARRWS